MSEKSLSDSQTWAMCEPREKQESIMTAESKYRRLFIFTATIDGAECGEYRGPHREKFIEWADSQTHESPREEVASGDDNAYCPGDLEILEPTFTESDMPNADNSERPPDGWGSGCYISHGFIPEGTVKVLKVRSGAQTLWVKGVDGKYHFACDQEKGDMIIFADWEMKDRPEFISHHSVAGPDGCDVWCVPAWWENVPPEMREHILSVMA